jgi:hypothetical protein
MEEKFKTTKTEPQKSQSQSEFIPPMWSGPESSLGLYYNPYIISATRIGNDSGMNSVYSRWMIAVWFISVAIFVTAVVILQYIS